MRHYLLVALMLTGCGTAPAPLAAAVMPTEAQAAWLTPGERMDALQQIRRLLEANTPDGRVEVEAIDVQQRLFGHRYPFKATKRVIRPLRTFVYHVEGEYNDLAHALRIDQQVELVQPN